MLLRTSMCDQRISQEAALVPWRMIALRPLVAGAIHQQFSLQQRYRFWLLALHAPAPCMLASARAAE